MKQELKQIYHDLSNGKLSQKEALDRIKAIKLRKQSKGVGVLFASRVWQSGTVTAHADANKLQFAGHHVILCELAEVSVEKLGLLLPQGQCSLLQAVEDGNLAQRYSEYALACFERIQSILRGKPQGKVLIQIVASHQEQTLLAGLSGLLKTAALENPRIIGQLILVPPDIMAEDLARCLREEKTGGLDALVRYEKGERQVLRWQEITAVPEQAAIAFKDQGVYLITGGLGSLGLLFVREILKQTGQARVVLTGRSALSAEKQSLLAGLSTQTGRVSYRQLDLGDLDQVKHLIAAIKDEYGAINGILHSAGMISDDFILKKTSAEFSQVLAPKVTGTYNLDQACQDVELDFFVLFSSAAGALGNVGQADYATANGFMDQFAAHRNRQVAARQRHGRTRSINWPLWQAGGIGLDAAKQELLRQTTGVQPMRTATGMEAFYRTLALPCDQILVLEGDLPRMRRVFLAGEPIQSELSSLPAAMEKPVASDGGDTAQIDPDSLAEKTQDYLRRQCSELLKLSSHKIDPQAALEKYGIDSILAVKLTNQLEKTFGPLSKTLFFEYQTIHELTNYFTHSHSARLTALFATAGNGNGRIKSADARPETRPPVQSGPESGRRFSRLRRAAPGAATESDAIAIIGLSGRYPEAINIEAYWRNLREGRDCIIEVPGERWDWREYFSDDRTEGGRHYSKWGGFIAGVDEFDPLFFNISPKEARYIDPQERLFLQHAWMAIEDAGYTRASLQTPCEQDLGQVGVYVGLMYSEYQLFGAEASVQGKRMGIAGSPASIANRVSYVLNLHGPSMTLDTMCSSSLSAIHVACQDLKQGRTGLAIAGGVNVSIHPNKYLVLSAGQFISSDGHCQSFGEGGDGYIPGEGVGVVVLKRLSEAKRDGDHIYGIIRGSALNHGGKTNGYTVPNPQAQSSAISKALAESNIDARHVSYIEAHGTGTKLGDPIEIAALNKAFQRYTQDKEFCLIGSAKSNIGHCESAAGIAGLTKVLLQMQHRQIVPSLHSVQLNPHIDFHGSPFVVNQALRPWEPPVVDGRTLPRIAGISSFGAGGSNAHMIVEEYQPPVHSPIAVTEVVLLLSARTAAQLQQKAKDLLEFVRARANTIDLAAIAYTLQVGREAMEDRLGFMVNSAEQAVEKLQAYVAGGQDIEDLYQGQVKRNKEAVSLFSSDVDLQQTVDRWIANRKFSKLLELWVKGLEVDWSKLYGDARPRRISLPVYPFAKERYWIEIPAAGQVAAKGVVNGAATAILHPLLHRNTSDLSEQRYSSTFTEEEFFVADYQVAANGHAAQKALSGVAYLEMARAAIEQAWPERQESAVLELCNTVWAQPIVVTEKKQISIALSSNDDGQIEYEIYSQGADDEIVHCQGRANWSRHAASATLNLTQLAGEMGQGPLEPGSVYEKFARLGLVYGPAFQGIAAIQRGRDQLLAQLRLPKAVESTARDYVLHPSLIDGALQAAVGLINSESGANQPWLPLALESLRIVSPCTREMFAWARHSHDSRAADGAVKLDIDLCDEQGNICAQMRGIRWQQASLVIVEPAMDHAVSPAASAAGQQVALAAPVLREIVFRGNTQADLSSSGSGVLVVHEPVSFQRTLARSRAPITLSKAKSGLPVREREAPAVSSLGKTTARPRASITLSKAKPGLSAREREAPAVSSVRLYDRGQGIFSIKVASSVSSNTTAGEMMTHLLQALNKVRQETSVKVLMLSGVERCFLRGAREEHNEAVEQNLHEAIVSFPCPVIATLPGDVRGAGLLAAALCDFMVCSEDATYGYTDAQSHFYPTAAEANLFGERFGAVQAQDFLYGTTAATGRQLRAKGWTCPIVPAAEVEACAEQIASSLAVKSQEALHLLKQHLARHLVSLAKELAPVEVAAPETESLANKAAAGTQVALPTEHIHLETTIENVVVVKFRAAHKNAGVRDLVADLSRVFAGLHQNAGCKAIVLASEHPGFFPETEQDVAEDVVLDFQRLVMDSPVPVVAALDGNAKGPAWLISQFCDARVYSQTGVYSSAVIGQSPLLAQTAVAFFTHRLGSSAGGEILLTGADYSGADLRQRAGAVLVAEHDQVLPAAVKVAESWARLPRTTLAAWKKHTATALQKKILSLPPAAVWEEKDEAPEPTAAAPASIPLQSKVVTATAHPEGIVVVKMEDRQAKNMFSEAFLDGVTEAFAHVEQTPAYKVVVLTGYDSYFASGGTKESLLAVQAGKAKFTDLKIFQVALDCKLPVIAAMQGHGIGAGWPLGMFADVVLLSKESQYVSPYMNYGFTPGAGATYILAGKIGNDLARESLLTGQPYTGSELKQRGLLLPVLPRGEVYAAAMALARQIAQASRSRLMWLKQQLAAHVHQSLEETYRLELAMHEKTFVGQSGTLAQIEKNFYQEVETSPIGEQQAHVELPHPSDGGDVLPAVTASLKTLLAQELQMRESDIDENVQFVDLGLDSISGLTWVRKINEKYRTAIEPTRVYSYPTLGQLSRFVKEEAEKQGKLSSPGALPAAGMPMASAKIYSSQSKRVTKLAGEKLASRRRRKASRFTGVPATRSFQPIAVIGMAGQFPQARNLEEFWQNIAQGRNCITRVPAQRWDVNAYYQPGAAVAGKTNSQWVGALEEYDRFDPSFFNISPVEAESMDPQQRLFLQACWHGIENAGYDARVLSGSKCGVFVGCVSGSYHRSSPEHQLSAQGFTGSAMSILAGRISYFLNLHGPCISIDTACSSSLVAIAHACDSLTSGGIDLALAGGVHVMAGPEVHIMSSQAGMLSPEGKCFTFDQRADGFVPGEGVGVVLLKRLDDAQKDQDIIYGVIQGWGVNQDGKTNGITAPNPESQTRLEQEVYDKYQINPESIQLLEAHGTGTKLGDPIEVEGLKKAFKKYTRNKEYCALGSVKSNIGHCATAAGVAGFIKLLLALKHRQLPPTINFERLNEHIDLQDSPFYVNSRLQEWKLKAAEGRRAAISSFGFSGTNAHIVIGEYLPPVEAQAPVTVVTPGTKAIIPLSARRPEQLKQRACDLRDFLRKEGPSVNLIELAYTLQVGREAMEERAGFVVSSVEQLAEKLEAYIEGKPEIEDFYQGQVKRNREALSLFTADTDLQQTIDKWIAGRKLSKLLDLWVKGLDLNWSKLYGEVKPQRISLPPYPFAKERYWLEAAASGHMAAGGAAIAALHPLLHSNTSDLNEQRYSSIFTGEEFFLAGYQLVANGHGGQKVLPQVAYLEMARAAIEQAWPGQPEAKVLELRDTAWAQPVVVTGNRQISIALLAGGSDQVNYEIYSRDSEQEVVHCQGGALWRREAAPARLEIEQLREQMNQGQLEPGSVYAACARTGLLYGPAFQGITAIHLGSNQVLAHLRLPGAIEDKSGDYVLHPCLMEGALQAAIGVINGGLEAGRPRQPFALESLRIISPCTREMVAWVRHSPGSHSADQVVKLDLDLCDGQGNVCVQMRGFALHTLSHEIGTTAAQSEASGSLLAIPDWQPDSIQASADAGKLQYTEHHVILCELPKVDVEKLESLLPGSQCLALRAAEPVNIAQRYSDYALACFERIAAIFESKPRGKVLVHIVAAGHQEQALFAGLSGLLKTAALENPWITGQFILTAPETTAGELAKQLQVEKSHALDPLIRYEQGKRQALRWREIAAESEQPPIAFQDHGVYLITGGLGGLGIIFAKEILKQTRQARVILTGRSALDAEKQVRLDGVSAEAGRLSYRQVALDNLDQVRQLVASICNEYGQLNGILHSAGMTADNSILKKPRGEFSEVLMPKVTGVYNLDQASQHVALDFFVVFSSSASVLGNLGQADYASANGFMDQFAAYRNGLVAERQRHGLTRSINWGLWQAGRMQIDSATQEMLKQITGVQSMPTATGLQAFYRCLAAPCDQMLVVEGIPARITTYLQRTRIFNPPSDMQTAASGRYANEKTEAAVSLEQLQQQLKTILSAVLRIKTPIIDVDQSFVEFGLDSILGAEMIVAINRKFGTELSNLKLFDYPNIREFALFLKEEIGKLPGHFVQPPVAPAVRSLLPASSSYPVLKKKARAGRSAAAHQALSDDRIAIIGMSGRYPQANDLRQYWNNLAAGRNSIVEVPRSRWDVNRYYDPDRATINKTYSKWLGALDDVDCFDPLFFRISPQEAEYMDPQHRLFLQESYKAFEDAGYSGKTLSNRKCGVYLGMSTNDYELLLVRNRILPSAITSNSHAIAAARIAYYLNLKGPAISVDTACSSSLVAMHLACQGLLNGETDMALAGGVTLWLAPEPYLAMSQAGMFSPSGQCKTFDDTADGIVNGEGVGAVVLKRLRDAQQDNDFIYGVILGSGMNQDGRTNGITAPSVQSQIELERSVYARYKIDPETISYVEAHGTGTKLGDPIELEALAAVFKEKTEKKNFCALGSVKSNIGHTTSAAGVAGVQKVLLSMRHRTLVPSLNVSKENSHFDFKNSPFYISRDKRAWEVALGSRRRAAVSSFGFSGTNAHMVIEEYVTPAGQSVPSCEPANFLVPLSARTAEQLRQKAGDLLAFISAPPSCDLAAMAYTLQAGREAMEERLGFIVSSAGQLAEKLQAYIAGERNIEDVYQGRVEPGSQTVAILGRDDDMQELIDKWIARRKLSKLLDLWVRGLNFDWNRLYDDVKPGRVSLPAYPFARERYWIDEIPAGGNPDNKFKADENMRSIEDIINEIDGDMMGTEQAVQALKMLV